VNHAVITSKRYNSHAIYGYLLYVKRPYSLSLSPGKTEGGRRVGGLWGKRGNFLTCIHVSLNTIRTFLL
jgi:hypothetical protein